MRFARYLSVQVAAYAIDMGGFILLSRYLLVPVLVANIISKFCSGIFSFAVNRAFTFGLQGADRAWRQAVVYFSLMALTLPMSSLVLHGVLQIVTWPVAAKFISDAICLVINYWLTKRVVFR
ncbi:GtrA family protein [Achromobacter xylosoxidans]|uniref:GtrA family protein n=1 Tax=Achromobacter TaxID=222 RepID=UPI0023B1ED95|nr:GtrA family protein [Achromobacter xylosoxidans]